jgi:hypothetical protein
MADNIPTDEVFYLVNQKLKESTIISFLNYISHHVAEVVIYRGCNIRDCALVFLFKLCYIEGYQKLEERCGIPHSTYYQIIGMIHTIVAPWCELLLKEAAGTSAQRLHIARENIDDADFQGATICLDE